VSAAQQTPLRVLVVDDDAQLAGILLKHLVRLGYSAESATSGLDALSLIDRGPLPDVILSDIRMPGMDGRTLLGEVRRRAPNVRVILMTAFGDVREALEATQEGAFWYLTKPFKVEEAAAILRNVATQVDLGRTVARLERQVQQDWGPERFLGRSTQAEEVRTLLRNAAGLASTVMLVGRSGTGKELGARILHHASARARGPFVPVNCGAIPEQLVEAEFFGHRRGAFTGADRDAPGLVEEAQGGTLFLDEVAELPLAQQPKLLRLLEQRVFRRVGDRVERTADVRVVAATNRSLEEMVRAGSLREDLYYRLNVITIRLPALAERPDDISLLAELLLATAARAAGLRARGFTEHALQTLRAYSWPGNVRELRNAVEHSLFRARGPVIDQGDLPEAVRGDRALLVVNGPDPSIAAQPAQQPAHPSALHTLEQVEREHIEQVLSQIGWNRSRAAQILGIDRRTLFSKLQKHGLHPPIESDKP